LKTVALIVSAVLAHTLACACTGLAAEPSRPNLLLIITDQQHAGMLGCAGNAYVKTPAMDSLARTGARFERAYCGNPVCVPSRFSMMTAVMPSRIGMEDNGGIRLRVPEEVLANTMGRVFRAAGYETVYGGKVHTPRDVGHMGFELLTRDSRRGLADACAEFLSKKRDRPFLLVASFINPHDICYMAIRAHAQAERRKEQLLDRGKVELGTLDEALKLPADVSREAFFARVCPPLPPNFEIPPGEPEAALRSDARNFRTYVRKQWSDEDWRLHRWAYARLTERVDSEIGQVLAAFRAAGLEESTAVVFTSDHGDMDSAHRLEHKSVMYEEATRVPLIVSRKGVTRPGLVDREHLVSTGLDLIPTLCDLAGVAPPPALRGRSVRPLAEGRAPQAWRECLVVEGRASRMVRSARFKYIVYESGERREQLIDLDKDPGEMQNLAADPVYAAVLAEHRRLLIRWYDENGEKLDPRYVVR